MAYVPVPKDLTRVKTKFLFNLTKRQVFCFGLGALVGVPLFFVTKDTMGSSMAALIMIAAMMPFFMFAIYEQHGSRLRCFCSIIFRRVSSVSARGCTRPKTSMQPSTRISAQGGR